MAVASEKRVASLMRKTLDRQAAVARVKLTFKPHQVENIIVEYVKGVNVGPFLELEKVLREYPLSDSNYKVLIEDCLSCVVSLGRELTGFVEILCNVKWACRSEDLAQLYGNFILGLVTAHTYHCPRVLTSLVKLFKAEGENWDDNPPKETLTTWSNIHTVIAQIVAIMPMTSDLLMQIVIDQYPYYKSGCYPNRAYIRNLIWITQYLPSLREHIMTAIINRMVEMDSNVVDLAKTKLQNELMFEMDMDEQDVLAQTLDYCMLEMLRWFEDERDVLATLCVVFERVVLPTHGIKHVQFLLLYAISINQQCADRVLTSLWKVAAGLHGSGTGALATRRTAASHLAGLLARCVRVPNSRLNHYLRSMSEWCHSYITATQESTSNGNTKVHGAFHAICHAVFYLVAFKHHHLFSSKENVNFVESLNLPRLVTCNLNPLRSCPPQVTRAFASATRSHQVVYCQAIIERNSRQTLHATNTQQYDDWFPYDPYMLTVSGKIIWPLCIEYKDWGKDDETQYAGMKRKFDAEEDDFLMSTSPSQKLASSLSNCISPGFRTSESVM